MICVLTKLGSCQKLVTLVGNLLGNLLIPRGGQPRVSCHINIGNLLETPIGYALEGGEIVDLEPQ